MNKVELEIINDLASYKEENKKMVELNKKLYKALLEDDYSEVARINSEIKELNKTNERVWC